MANEPLQGVTPTNTGKHFTAGRGPLNKANWSHCLYDPIFKGDLEMEKGKSFHTLNLIDLKSPYATELFKILPSGVYYSTMSET